MEQQRYLADAASYVGGISRTIRMSPSLVPSPKSVRLRQGCKLPLQNMQTFFG